MTENDLSAIVAGDTVALSGGYGSTPTLHQVRRITGTQIVIGSLGKGSDWRFRRDTGYEVGGRSRSWGLCRISVVTDSIREAIRRQKALDALNNKQWDALDLEAVLTILQAREKK